MTHHFMESSIILFSTPLLWYNFNQRSCLIPKIPNLCLSFQLVWISAWPQSWSGGYYFITELIWGRWEWEDYHSQRNVLGEETDGNDWQTVTTLFREWFSAKLSTFTHRLLNATLIESQVKFSSPRTSMEPHRKAMLRQTTEGTAEVFRIWGEKNNKMNYGAHLAHPKIDVIRGLLQGCATFPWACCFFY